MLNIKSAETKQSILPFRKKNKEQIRIKLNWNTNNIPDYFNSYDYWDKDFGICKSL